jgi:hypothetical protein
VALAFSPLNMTVAVDVSFLAIGNRFIGYVLGDCHYSSMAILFGKYFTELYHFGMKGLG